MPDNVTKVDLDKGESEKAIEGVKFWRLCRQYTVAQAALLIAGHDPATALQVEMLDASQRPSGYEAVKHALEQALKRDEEFGSIAYPSSVGPYPDYRDPIDVLRSLIWSSKLKLWLASSGLKTNFPFDEVGPKSDDTVPAYLNPSHPRYSAKLAAAIHAWEACDGPLNGRPPKQVLAKWIISNASKYQLSGEYRKISQSAVEQIAGVANWNTKGGAPTTPAKE